MMGGRAVRGSKYHFKRAVVGPPARRHIELIIKCLKPLRGTLARAYPSSEFAVANTLAKMVNVGAK